jgi:hypothetical protein
MGVHATFCAICGLPVQHDHYVATEKQDMWAIYRSDNRPQGHFPFLPEHDWLLRGVAINTEEGPFFGTCEDGALIDEDGESYYVGRDNEDYTALHAYCWRAAGQPTDYDQMSHYQYAYDRTFLSKYQEQLFDFFQCARNDDGWLLLDPEHPDGARNKARIEALLKIRPTPVVDGQEKQPGSVAELLKSDVWRLEYRPYDEGKHDVWRFRANITPEIDKSGYPHMWWLISDPGQTPLAEMERFERAFYEAVQASGLAIALATVTVRGRYYFVLQTRDPDACQKELARHRPPGGLELQSEIEPEWTGYFQEFHSRFDQLRGY